MNESIVISTLYFITILIASAQSYITFLTIYLLHYVHMTMADICTWTLFTFN